MYPLPRFGGLTLGWFLIVGPVVLAAKDNGLQPEIDRAVKRGVAYLKQLQEEDGSWARLKLVATFGAGGKDVDVGATALAALALLECGVPAKSEVIQKAAAVIRPQTVSLTYTYSLALSIMFLDRLGDPGDVPLIESMAVRLLGGQTRQGGWGYSCPSIDQDETRRLIKQIKLHNELVSKGKLPKKSPQERRTEKDLPKEIVAQLIQINRRGLGHTINEDNSNTQFATMALWIARRHGLPVDQALGRIDARFRASQDSNGGWGYQWVQSSGRVFNPFQQTNAAMTCAGLLGLAVGHGAVNDRILHKGAKRGRLPNPSKDPVINGGLIALATCVGEPAGDNKDSIPIIRGQDSKAYYYLWSLERVCVVYGLAKIGKKDWYRWGAEILLANQSRDGSWKGGYPEGGIDTCFALLFLSRSNLAPDLTATLKGAIPHAGEKRTLKSGGVGGQALVSGKVGKGIEPGINAKTRPTKEDGGPASKKPVVVEKSADQDNAEIARLSTQLVQASEAGQEDLIAKLKKGKGLVYTEALAGSIALLKGPIQTKARAALTDRMSRMSAETLRDKLQDDNLEVRRAAAFACAHKKSKAHIRDLIGLLQDGELVVADAAHEALKTLTAQDFGPEPDATRAERKRAVDQWKKWWKKQRRG